MCVVSHPRSGTHFLCKTIFDNFQNPYRHYFDFFASHKNDIEEVQRKFPRASIVHIIRDIESTLKSVFRMRERNGIDFCFNNFSDFLRTRYIDMPRTPKTKTFMNNNNKTVQHRPISWIGKQSLTPIEQWLETNLYWFKQPQVMSITYHHLKNNPEDTMIFLQQITSWKKKPSFVACTERVGLSPMENGDFDISNEDKLLLVQAADSFYQEIGYEPFIETC